MREYWLEPPEDNITDHEQELLNRADEIKSEKSLLEVKIEELDQEFDEIRSELAHRDWVI